MRSFKKYRRKIFTSTCNTCPSVLRHNYPLNAEQITSAAESVGSRPVGRGRIRQTVESSSSSRSSDVRALLGDHISKPPCVHIKRPIETSIRLPLNHFTKINTSHFTLIMCRAIPYNDTCYLHSRRKFYLVYCVCTCSRTEREIGEGMLIEIGKCEVHQKKMYISNSNFF